MLELETNLIDARTEISKLKDEKITIEDEMKTKDDQNTLLITEKNMIEENVVRLNGIIQKMYQERTKMKSIIDTKKTTIELTNDSSKDVDTPSSELAAKLAKKIKELEEANTDKRRLAKDLAAVQNKQHEAPEADMDKCSKLTNLLKNKNVETEKANKEVKRITTANKQLQESLNKTNNKLATIEAKNVRLEKQVDDLIDTCGKATAAGASNQEEDHVRKIPSEKPRVEERYQGKCYHNDKGRCRNGSNCQFQHSSVVCRSFSKNAVCENHDQCLKRHPEGVCLHWKKGHCTKDDTCFFRHPENEFGTMQHSPDYKRKRTFSNSYSPNQKSSQDFLYQKFLEVSKELKFQKAKNASREAEQYLRQNQPQFLIG